MFYVRFVVETASHMELLAQPQQLHMYSDVTSYIIAAFGSTDFGELAEVGCQGIKGGLYGSDAEL